MPDRLDVAGRAPERIDPMLATAAGLPADEAAWAFEVKWDGVRAIARSERGHFALLSRTGRDITEAYPELHALRRALGARDAILDGEVIAFDARGRQSFQAVQQRIHTTGQAAITRLRAAAPVTYMVFDVLWLDGETVMNRPYEERRALLDGLGLQGEHWDVPPFHIGAGTALLAATAEQRLEGVIAKRLGSIYEAGARAASWRKIKHTRRQEVVIGGVTPGRGGRSSSFGALQVGVYDGGALRYAGGVGSGFTEAALTELLQELGPLGRDDSPFTGRQPPPGCRFVEPRLVCDVEFAEWTGDGSLRHARFKGLRHDRPAAAVRREDERPADDQAGLSPAAVISARPSVPQPRLEAEVPAAGSRDRPAKPGLVIDGTHVTVDGRDVGLTNLDKVLYPETGATKRDVITYYAAIAPALLPHLAGRPITLRRYPDGVDQPSFFEKHASRHRPEWVETVTLPAGSKTIEFVTIPDTATLLWTANLAALELHPSLSTGAHPERPTALVFDLDPGPPASIVECCTVALQIRDLLTQLDLACWAKTSGSKGLQLYAPINVDVTYEDTKPFAQAVASLLEDRHPELVVSRQARTLRPGKVLIDWSQNDRHKTTVSVYSLRARATTTVSTPVTWDEVEACAEAGDPGLLQFDASAALARVAQDGDHFAPLLTLQQDLPPLGRHSGGNS